MERAELEQLIRTAFFGVMLGGGVSLRQTDIMDNYGVDQHGNRLSAAEWARLKLDENNWDWTTLSVQHLNNSEYHFSYLDAEGFRFYIPAYMLLAFEGHDNSDIYRLIHALTPKPKEKDADNWEYRLQQYSLLNEEQRFAVAQFLHSLPNILNMDIEGSDRKDTNKALENYWGQFLIIAPPKPRKKHNQHKRKK